MESRVNVMVVSTCIRGIFYFEVFDENKVFDDFYCFNLSIAAEKISD